MANLRITEIKAFVPAKDFAISKQFYKDLGFTMASEGDGVAYFHFEHVSFLLQDFCVNSLAENFMMHILVPYLFIVEPAQKCYPPWFGLCADSAGEALRRK